MPRPRRPLAAGLTYHVTSRGNARARIFHDAADRELFLAVFTDVVCERRWSVLAWCVLGTHYHLLLRTPDPDLDRGMWKLNGTYARHHHRRYGTCGHVFGDRYWSGLVTRDSHLLMSLAYIARNPVEAGLVTDPAEWRWSSHHLVTGGLASDLLDRQALLAHTGALGGDPLDRYRRLVEGDMPAQTVTGDRPHLTDPAVPGDSPHMTDRTGRRDRPHLTGGVGMSLEALGLRARRVVVEALLERELSMEELTKAVGATRTTLGDQLGVLRQAGLVGARADGRRQLHGLRPEGFRVLEAWAAGMAAAASGGAEEDWLARVRRAEQGGDG